MTVTVTAPAAARAWTTPSSASVQDDAGKWDLPALRRDLRLSGGRLCLPDAYEGEFPTALSLSPWARVPGLRKSCGIPAAYFARCAPGLQDAQFNHWLWRTAWTSTPTTTGSTPPRAATPAPRRWLLRGKGSTARAVLSSRYAVLDNRDVLAALAPALDRRYRVTWSALTDASFHLRLVDPDRNAAASQGRRPDGRRARGQLRGGRPVADRGRAGLAPGLHQRPGPAGQGQVPAQPPARRRQTGPPAGRACTTPSPPPSPKRPPSWSGSPPPPSGRCRTRRGRCWPCRSAGA